MKTRLLPIAFGACLLAASLSVNAQGAKKRTSGETTLVGVSLYDSGLKLIKMFGSPNEIQPVTLGGGGGGMSGGGGAGPAGSPMGSRGAAPMGGPGGGGPAGAPAGGGKGPMPGARGTSSAGYIGDPFGLDSETWQQDGEDQMPGGRPGARGGPPPGAVPGYGPGGPSGGFGGSASPGGFGGATSTERATFTRWVYRRPSSRYAFILDKFNKVVQIEVIGLKDPKVRTKRGLGLGATFGQIMTKYPTPDGYDISGDSLVIRYLVHDKVAFRLSRLEPNQPHRVTGVVVAAGKS